MISPSRVTEGRRPSASLGLRWGRGVTGPPAPTSSTRPRCPRPRAGCGRTRWPPRASAGAGQSGGHSGASLGPGRPGAVGCTARLEQRPPRPPLVVGVLGTPASCCSPGPVWAAGPQPPRPHPVRPAPSAAVLTPSWQLGGRAGSGRSRGPPGCPLSARAVGVRPGRVYTESGLGAVSGHRGKQEDGAKGSPISMHPGGPPGGGGTELPHST